MELKEYNLPEWCFLDGYSHQGDQLKGREVILHTPSMSILEVICLDDQKLYLNEGGYHLMISLATKSISK